MIGSLELPNLYLIQFWTKEQLYHFYCSDFFNLKLSSKIFLGNKYFLTYLIQKVQGQISNTKKIERKVWKTLYKDKF